MLGAGLQFGRSHGDDRFCNPAKARRNSESQNHHNLDHLRRAQSNVTVRSQFVSANEKPVVTLESREREVSPLCNLDRFLEAVTPSVPAQYPSKTTLRGWRTCDVEFQPYFVLGDLWESFREWSVYGAGVPLVLDDSDSVVQYYVPFLSAIQIYVNPSKSSSKLRQPSEDSDGDYFRDSSSDGSSDSDHERCPLHFKEQHNHQHLKCGIAFGMDRPSMQDQHNALLEGFSSDEGESGNPRGCLLFEYLERNQPHCREPLADKIANLALHFPELKTLRSCDLLSCSWISVAWYPIYRIPTGPTLKDLDACFLTFHSLHTPTSVAQSAQIPAVSYPNEMDDVPMISLPVSGLAAYKFKASWWTPNVGSDRQLLSNLMQDAEELLSMLQVNHPDFLFFSRR